MQEMQWSIGSERPKIAQEARWWIPDADVHDVLIPVESVSDIVDHLKSIPEAEVVRKLEEMKEERLRFTFQASDQGQTI